MLVCAPTGAGKTVVGEFAVHLALAQRPQVLLHHADQGAVQPEVQRPGRAARRRQGRPAHRRQRDQRRRAGGGDDHRGAAQHALRRLADARRARLRGDGRGALPGRPVPRRGVGGGDHPPARARCSWSRCRRRSPTPRSSPTGWSPCAARPRWWSTSTGRCRCGSTCWSAGGCSTCSTTTTRRRRARGAPGAAAPHPTTWPAAGRPRRPTAGRGGAGRGARPARRRRGGRLPAAVAGGGRRAARPRGPAAGDPVHLQPGRLRRRGAAVPARRAAADRPDERAEIRQVVDRSAPPTSRGGPRRPGLLGVARRPGARARRPPRRHAAGVQGDGRGAVRPRPGARRSSPPRRWRWASTCRPGAWCWSGWSSSTARRTST